MSSLFTVYILNNECAMLDEGRWKSGERQWANR